MTSQTQDKHWAHRFALWLRDHFASWFAGSFVMAGLFLCILVSIGVGMFFDGEYAKRWTPDPEWEPVFQLFGWSISWFMILGSAAGVKALKDGARVSGGILISVSAFFTLLSITQSIGIVALTAQDMAAQADAYERVTERTETVNTNRIEELESQREELRAERDVALAGMERTLANMEDDGVAGIGSGDRDFIESQRAEVSATRESYRERIQAVSDMILAEYQTTPQDIAPVVAERPPSRFDAVIDILGWAFTFGHPTDEFKEGLTIVYVTFWSLGCPLMGQMLSVFLVITRHNSDKKRAHISDDGATIEINGEKVDPSEAAFAWQKHQNQKEAAQKAAETRKANAQREEVLAFLDADPWKLQMHDRIWGMHLSGMPASEIAQSVGWTPQEFENNLRILFFPDQIEAINAVRKDGGSLDVAAE